MHLNVPKPPSDSFSLLDERIQRWIWQSKWAELKDAQERAIPIILAADTDVIIAAATASGKTEAAFLPILTRLLTEADMGCVLYISPLKALINDQWWRLEGLCATLDIRVTPWHGDSAGAKKRAFLKAPQGCLLITPESLEALLMANGHALQGLFGKLRYVVVDELHAFIGTERGKQLQSQLHRLDAALKRPIPRIALSATLGDMAKAEAFLRPNAAYPITTIISRDPGPELKVLVKGYVQTILSIDAPKPFVSETADDEGDEEDEETPQSLLDIGGHLFKTLRGSNNLIFPNSRRHVEFFADDLRRRCRTLGVPNEFWPHHGSLAKDIREETEAALKSKERPATAICTTTLELGIDLGAVKSIAQIGCAPSVASLRQRLGRSGRRPGEPAILRCYAQEAEITAQTPLADELREGLVQSIAHIRLLLRGWYEPPLINALHLSTFIQQLLSLIAQYGGLDAARAWSLLCGDGAAFANVSKADFTALLRALGGRDILMQTADGLLLHGAVGEKLVNHYSFYAAFAAPEEFRLVCGSKNLGTLPLSQPVEQGSHLIFAGKRWRVKDLDLEKRLIQVTAARGGKIPTFQGDAGSVDDGVREEMRLVLAAADPIVFLDATAASLLKEARAAFVRLGLDKTALLPGGNHVLLFPWRGDRVMDAIGLMLKSQDLDARNFGLYLHVDAPPKHVADALRRLAGSPPPDPPALASQVLNKWLEKWDYLLPAELLAKNYASYRLDVTGAHQAIMGLAGRV